MAGDDQKTHDPTTKKLADARRKGDVATAPEMRHAIMFIAAVVITGGLGAWTFARLAVVIVRIWSSADDYGLSSSGAQNFAAGILRSVIVSMAPVLILMCGFALLTIFSQGRPSLSWSRITFKWSKLSPAAGLGRIFGGRALIEFGKTLLKLTAIVTVTLYVIWPRMSGMDLLVGAAPAVVGRAAAADVLAMVKATAVLVTGLAVFDFIYQRRAFLKKMMMSLQEIKDEHKDSEGDPKIKAKIRSISMQRARRRMMAAVPGASVVITNPTHYAVALAYDHGKMAAPVVVAKGADEVALRIREVAKKANVPIIESPVLARAMFATAEIDQPIPTEHYAAVAEIVGYVMRLAARN